MIRYSKIVARMVGTLIFFLVFFSVLFYYNFPPDFDLFFKKFLLALLYAVVAWFWSIVTFDLLFKGIVEDIEDCGVEGLLEGGIFQRFQILRKKILPGGEYMPFVKTKVEIKSSNQYSNKENRNGN